MSERFIDLNTGEPVDEANATPAQKISIELFNMINRWQADGVDYQTAIAVLSESIGAILATMAFTETAEQVVMRNAYGHAVKSLLRHKRAKLLDQDFNPDRGRAN